MGTLAKLSQLWDSVPEYGLYLGQEGERRLLLSYAKPADVIAHNTSLHSRVGNFMSTTQCIPGR